MASGPGETVRNGAPPYAFAATGLTGFTMASDGVLTHTTAAEGSYNFTVRITDSVGKTKEFRGQGKLVVVRRAPVDLLTTTPSMADRPALSRHPRGSGGR